MTAGFRCLIGPPWRWRTKHIAGFTGGQFVRLLQPSPFGSNDTALEIPAAQSWICLITVHRRRNNRRLTSNGKQQPTRTTSLAPEFKFSELTLNLMAPHAERLSFSDPLEFRTAKESSFIRRSDKYGYRGTIPEPHSQNIDRTGAG